MILAVSIGNTNIRCAFGTAEKYDQIIMPLNDLCEPEDFISLLNNNHNLWKDITGSIVASVVPEKTQIVAKAIEYSMNIMPYFVDVTKCGIDVSCYEGTLGQDRVICAAAALLKYPLPLITVDFGTATSINVINSEKMFLGGAIMTGVQMGLNALSENTSLLPKIEDMPLLHIIGRNTRECIISGAVTVTLCAIQGYIDIVSEELGAKPSVVITGGNASALLSHCRFEFVYEQNLAMDGLYILYNKIINKENVYE